MPKPVLLWVEWVDSSLLINQWADDNDLHGTNPPIVSVGFKVKSEDGFLILAASWQRDDTTKRWAQPIAIPERAIVRKRRMPHGG